MTTTNSSIRQLIDGFHQSLQRNSIPELKKSFQTYLKSLKANTNGDEQKLSAVVDGIIPQDFWESALKVDIILHYKLFTHAFEVFKSEHKVLVSRLLKSEWFIKKLLETFTAQQFVNELFCFTSVSSRTKIINRLIKYNKDEEFGKQLFEAYAEKYGLRAAKQLLPLCPLAVIEDVVINKKIKPSRSTIRKVIGKDLKLVKHFFSDRRCRNYHDVKYIARTNLPFYFELLREKHSEIISGIGNSTTHKLISAYKSYILDNPECLKSHALNLKRVYYDLKDDYEQLVFKLIATNGYAESFGSFARILRPMPKEKQRILYLNAFKESANCNLDERPDCIDESFLGACEDVNERAKYAELAYNMNKKTHWIKYMRTDTAISLLKEKIEFGITSRDSEEFVKALLETCKINDDKAALLDVLKYVTKSFQNDKEDVIVSFCSALLEHFKLYELGKEHWKYIIELQKLCEVNDESFSDYIDITQEQIMFCLKNNEPIDDLLAKLSVNIEYNYRSELGLTKELILKSVTYINGTKEDENHTKFNAYLQLLDAMQEYNEESKADFIDIRETLPIKWMVERLEEGYKSRLTWIDSLFTYCLFGDAEPEEQNKAIRVLLMKPRLCYKILLHFVKDKPNILIDNIDLFLKSNAFAQIFKRQSLLKYYRRLSHLNQTVLEYFKTNLRIEGVNPEDKIKSLKALAVCMNEEDYLKLIAKYRPDTKSHKCTGLRQCREAICESIIHLNTPSKALDALLPFCVGDHLKFCLKGLYHFIFHTQERNIPRFINELKSKSVLARKHAALLSLSTLDRKHNLQFFENYTEQNPSVIAHILKTIFKYFTTNLDKNLFEVFKVLLKQIDKNDEKSLKFITQKNAVPEMFFAEYVEFVWNTIESFGKQDSDFEDTKFALLHNLTERDYYLLDDKFLDRIVKENYLKHNKFARLLQGTTDFVVRYLMYCKSVVKQNYRLQLVFEVLRDFKKADPKKALNSGTYFIKEFCRFALEKQTPTIPLMKKFKELFHGFTDVAESFDEHLDLDLLELHIWALGYESYVTNFSGRIAYYLIDFERNYDICLLVYNDYIVVDFIQERLKELKGTLYEDNMYLFLEHLYATYDGLASAVIVTNLLVKLNVDAAYDVLTRKRQEDLIAKLKSRKELIIKVLLASYFRNRA